MRLTFLVLASLFLGSNADGDILSTVSYNTQKYISDTIFYNCTVLKIGVTWFKNLFGMADDPSKVTLNLYSIDGSKTSYSLPTAGSLILKDKRLPKKFDINLPVVIYIPGFMEDGRFESTVINTRALLKRGGLNVLAVDSSAITRMIYVNAANSVEFIGNAIGKVLVDFYNGGVSPKNIHIVGFSLGGHMAGFAGKYFQAALGKNISRITGLDPAGPCFFEKIEDLRLRNTDADFVDVIHTDAGSLGIIAPIGHADFYPNNGSGQPGGFVIGLNHLRAYALYAESIYNEKAFLAVKCKDWSTFNNGDCSSSLETVYMGYGVSTAARGIYYLVTKGTSPYSLCAKSIQPQNVSWLDYLPFTSCR